MNQALSLWLCHSDARQVSDLPSEVTQFFPRVSDPAFAVRDRRILRSADGKSETCRASEWQSQNNEAFLLATGLTIKISDWLHIRMAEANHSN